MVARPGWSASVQVVPVAAGIQYIAVKARAPRQIESAATAASMSFVIGVFIGCFSC